MKITRKKKETATKSYSSKTYNPYSSYYHRYSYFRPRHDNRFKLKKKILLQKKFVNGKEQIKKRILHVPVDKKFHAKLLEEAKKFYWFRSENSFGSIQGVQPNEYVNKIAGPDLQIQCDIKDCFPSITSNMTRKALDRFTNLKSSKKGRHLKELLIRAAFVKSPIGDFLAQGVNVSQLLCNTVLTELDLKVERMILNEQQMLVEHDFSRIKSYANQMFEVDELTKDILDYVSYYTSTPPIIKYSRYVDNIAISFWNFPDSFRDLRYAQSLEKNKKTNAATSIVKIHMRCRERIWRKVKKILNDMKLVLNEDKTKFRRKYGKKSITFVGYTLNERPRAKKHYIEKLRCKLHNFRMYLRDCKDEKAILVYNPRWLEQLKGQCVWIFTCDPIHRRITKCLKEVIELEKKVIGSNILASLEKFLG